MIKGVGVDIVEIPRVENRIAKKILSNNEFTMFLKMNELRQKEFLSGRFAVKEALFKAGLKKPFNEMDIKYNEDESI